MTNLLTVLRELIKRNRIAYKDYLGEETVTNVICEGTVADIETIEDAFDLLLTKVDQSFTGFVLGESYDVTIDGVMESKAPMIIDGTYCLISIEDLTIEELPESYWIVMVEEEYILAMGYGSFIGKTISISQTATVKKYDVKKLPDELLPETVNKKIAKAQSTANSAKTAADKAKSSADNAYDRANDAYNRTAISDWNETSTSSYAYIKNKPMSARELVYSSRATTGTVDSAGWSVSTTSGEFSALTADYVMFPLKLYHTDSSGTVLFDDDVLLKRKTESGVVPTTSTSVYYYPIVLDLGVVDGEQAVLELDFKSICNDAGNYGFAVDFRFNPLRKDYTLNIYFSISKISCLSDLITLPECYLDRASEYKGGIVKAPAKTDADETPVSIDDYGYLWAAPGDFEKLENKPDIEALIPTKVSELTNDSGFVTADDVGTIPTKVSELTNDSGFVTEEDLPEVVQPDWNQNDETAPDYVKNRTHWAEPIYTLFVPTQHVSYAGEGVALTIDESYNSMIGYNDWSGATLYFMVDGVYYEIEFKDYVYESSVGLFFLGNTSIVFPDKYSANEFPFCVSLAAPYYDHYYDSPTFYSETEGEHSVGISIQFPKNKTFHKLAAEYLPDWLSSSEIGDIQSTANTAQSMANTAQSMANTAQSTADTAQSMADTAQSMANTAQSMANTAQSMANTAQSTAESKADAADPVCTGSFSQNRKPGTTVGTYSHAEGYYTTASGDYSHAEGHYTTADGAYNHAEGHYTTASGTYSHAEGHYTTANGSSQHAQGKYNITDTINKYAHIVGNGTSGNARSNAHTLDWDGNAWFQGDVLVGGTSQDNGERLAKVSELVGDDHINELISSEKFTVTATTDDISAGTVTIDKTLAEIEEAYQAGKTLSCKVVISGDGWGEVTMSTVQRNSANGHFVFTGVSMTGTVDSYSFALGSIYITDTGATLIMKTLE